MKYLRFTPSGGNNIGIRKSEFVAKTQFLFKNLIIHKPSLGSREFPQKIWARSVQPFGRLLDTNRETNKQTDKPNLYIDEALNMTNM